MNQKNESSKSETQQKFESLLYGDNENDNLRELPKNDQREDERNGESTKSAIDTYFDELNYYSIVHLTFREFGDTIRTILADDTGITDDDIRMVLLCTEKKIKEINRKQRLHLEREMKTAFTQGQS